jgi:VanZ family protein
MGPQLRYRALWLTGGWLIVAAILWLSLIPAPPKLDIDEGDKLAHFVGYGLLMFWFCEVYAESLARFACGAAWTAMGVAIEFLQGALGYRSYEPVDMLANTVGVLLGFGVALAAGGKIFESVERLVGRR